MHLQFEHENDITGDDEDDDAEENNNEEYK